MWQFVLSFIHPYTDPFNPPTAKKTFVIGYNKKSVFWVNKVLNQRTEMFQQIYPFEAIYVCENFPLYSSIFRYLAQFVTISFIVCKIQYYYANFWQKLKI